MLEKESDQKPCGVWWAMWALGFTVVWLRGYLSFTGGPNYWCLFCPGALSFLQGQILQFLAWGKDTLFPVFWELSGSTGSSAYRCSLNSPVVHSDPTPAFHSTCSPWVQGFCKWKILRQNVQRRSVLEKDLGVQGLEGTDHQIKSNRHLKEENFTKRPRLQRLQLVCAWQKNSEFITRLSYPQRSSQISKQQHCKTLG